MFKSTDGGASWTRVAEFGPTFTTFTTFIRALVIDPKTPSTVYMGYSACLLPHCQPGSGVRKSGDGGITWGYAGTGANIYNLAIDPASPSTLYATGRRQFALPAVYRTTNGGAMWSLISDFDLGPIAIDAAAANVLYAGSRQGGVFRSTDSGAGWSRVGSELPAGEVTAVATAPTNPTTVYAIAGGSLFAAVDPQPVAPAGDYDGDGRADMAVYRPATAEWFLRRSIDAGLVYVPWGSVSDHDVPVPGDYDGDGLTDIAVYRPGSGEWFVRRSMEGGTTKVAWGSPTHGDLPVPGDYDGDGRLDIAVYRQDYGEWFIRRSSGGGLTYVPWGAPSLGDLPARP